MRDGWRETALGQVATATTSQVPAATSGLPYYGLEHFDSGSPRISRSGDSAAMDGPGVTVSPGDVLFSKLRPYLNKVAVAGESAVASTEVLVYRPVTTELDASYLALLLRDARAVDYAVARSAGSRMPRTSAKVMAELPIALPPLDEQRRIVDLIAAVDDAVDAAEAEAGATLSLLQAALDVHLDQAESMRSIADIALQPRGLVGGPFGSSLISADYRDTGVPIIRGTNMPGFLGTYVGGDFAFVDPSKADALSGNLALPGDVVFTQRGTIGQVGMVPDDEHSRYVVSQSQMRLRVDPALSTPEYVRFVFTAPAMVSALRAQDRATANPHINLGVLAKTEVPVPPLHVQDALVSDWGALQSAAEAARATANALRALRSNLLTVLLSGEHEIPSSYDVLLEEVA